MSDGRSVVLQSEIEKLWEDIDDHDPFDLLTKTQFLVAVQSIFTVRNDVIQGEADERYPSNAQRTSQALKKYQVAVGAGAEDMTCHHHSIIVFDRLITEVSHIRSMIEDHLKAHMKAEEEEEEEEEEYEK